MEEFNLSDLLQLFWRKKFFIIIITILALLLGTVYSMLYKKPEYTASTTLVLALNSTNTETTTSTASSTISTDLTVNSKLVSTYSELVKSKTVLREVISYLDNVDITEDNLRKEIKVSSVKDTDLISIDVTNADPELATKIANQISTVFTEKVKDIYKINNVYTVDKAEVPTVPVNINHIKDIAEFGIIGFILAIFIVLIRNMLDNTIKTEDEIEKLVSIPVTAQIPLDDEVTKNGGNV